MNLVKWIDDNGYRHQAWLRNGDKDPEKGIRNDPPDVNRLNWEEIKRNIHNALVDQNLVTWEDVQAKQNAIGGIILAEVRKPLLALYRSNDNGE